MTLETVALTYGVFMASSPLMQAYRLWKQRSSEDVSLVFFTVLSIGFVLFLAYGLQIGNRLLIVTNSLSLITYGVTIVVAIWMRRHPGTRVADTSTAMPA